MKLRIKDYTIKVGSGVTPRGGAETYLDKGIPLFRSQNVTNEGFLMDGIAFISEDVDEAMKGTRVKQGDVLLNITGASIGRCYYTSEIFQRGNVNQHVCIIRPKKNIVKPNYLHYCIISDIGQQQIELTQTGANREGLSVENIKGFLFDVPSLSDQQRIVDYLDAKLATIDKRIAVLAKQQDAYMRLKKSIIHQTVTRGLNPDVRLKDSGIEWIGMIPEHWKCFRLKDLGYMYSGLTGKSGDDFRCEDETKTKPYVPFTNILNNTVVDNKNFHNVVMGEHEQQNQVKTNDLLFLMSSEDYESIAKSAVVIGTPGEVYLNSFCRGLRITYENCYSPFLNYQLNSEMYRDALRFEARGFTRINIKIDRVASHFVSLPPLSEQQAIANYLDEKCSKIDAAIDNIGKQINASKRLKRALINEVITGQRAV
ncbi:restriction endonuclease subunit S [Bacteroides sp.]